jgi:flavin reductase (DIM6/NTAB) family NADH-FMN oxidoreductase RutF
MKLDPKEMTPQEVYKVFIGSVLPRAIGWVSTLSGDNIANLAPISFFTVVSRQPPIVSLTIQPRSDGVTLKDTLVNIRETGQFVVNVVSLAQVNEMNKSSVEYPPEVDEFKVVGLDRLASDLVRPPRVAGAPITMECELERIIPIGEVGDHVVFGKVVRFHIRDDLWLDNGRIDTVALQAVGRMASEYTLANTVFGCPVPQEVINDPAATRPRRLDGKPDDWSPLDQKGWSAAGNAKVD